MDNDSKKDAKAIFQRQPYYECIFCKRGLSTAQALGGHMNIHRKHRAMFQQPPAVAKEAAAAMPLFNRKTEEDGMEIHGSSFSHVPLESSGYTTRLSLNESWLGHGDMLRESVGQEDQISSGRSQEVKLPGDDLELSLTLHISDSDLPGGGLKEQVLQGEVLDLELRLGHS